MNQWQQTASGEQEGHLIAKKQMKGFGGMLSFMLKQDTLNAVNKSGCALGSRRA